MDRTLADERITESSGLAASVRHPGVLWTHNDSGDAARLYAVGPDGSTLATLVLAGQEPRDWEAMTSDVVGGGTPVLYVGDIGDNSGSRTNGILVHRLEEPAVLADAEVPVVSYRLRYPEGPADAEALLVDPRSGGLVVVTKGLLGGGVYAAPVPLDADAPNVLSYLGAAPGLVTDGAFLPDGRIVLRGYDGMWVGTPEGGWGRRLPLPPSSQGESLAVAPGGAAVYVGSEGEGSPVWLVPLPADCPGAGCEDPDPAPVEAAPELVLDEGWTVTWRSVLPGLAAFGLVAAAAVALASRRRR